MEFKVVEKILYKSEIKGISIASGNLVTIIGEQTVEFKGKQVISQYIYNIDGHTSSNGLPFATLKSNIQLL